MSDLKVRFEGRFKQQDYENLTLANKVDPGTLYFIRDTRRIYIGDQLFVDDGSGTSQKGIPMEYQTVLPDGTVRMRRYSEDGDDWRIVFSEKKPNEVQFKHRHSFEFSILEGVPGEGQSKGVIKIDNVPVFYSDVHHVFCENVDQVIDGVKTVIGDWVVPEKPKSANSATSKSYVDSQDGHLRSELREEQLRAESSETDLSNWISRENERALSEESRIESESMDRDRMLGDRINEERDRATGEEDRIELESKARDQELHEEILAEKERAEREEARLDDVKLDKDVFQPNRHHNQSIIQDLEIKQENELHEVSVESVVRDVVAKEATEFSYPIKSEDETIRFAVTARTDSSVGELSVEVDQDKIGRAHV